MDDNVYIYQYVQYIISQLEQKNREIVSLSREFEQVGYTINDLFLNGNPVRYHTDTKLLAALESYHEMEQKAIFAFKQVDKFSDHHVSLLAHWEPDTDYSNVMLEYSPEDPLHPWIVTLTREDDQSFIDEGIREYFKQYQDARDFFDHTVKTYRRGNDDDNNPLPELTEEFISTFASMYDYRFYHYQRFPGEKTEEGKFTSNYSYLGLWISVVRNTHDNKFVRAFYP